MQIRIQGLIKFLNSVRAQLREGIPPGRMEAFQREILQVLREVETVCRQHGGTPDHLPAPSRNAYNFLRNLDLTKLPVSKDNVTKPVISRTIGLKNVVKMKDYFAQHFWKNKDQLAKSGNRRQKFLEKIREQTRGIEELCAEQNVTPASLARPSRQVYCWLKYLSDKENLKAHLRALQIAQKALDAIAPHGSNPPVEVHMTNIRFIYRVKRYTNCIILNCSEGFVAANEAVWSELLSVVFNGKQGRGVHSNLDAFMDSEAFSGVLYELESTIAPTDALTKGHTHDLAASFDRVNRRYFAGKMPRPRLHWNRAMTHGKMGHYQSVRDTVMISLTLDQPEVPVYVIDFVMYHELLHKKLGAKLVNGRRYAHTPEFRAEERMYRKYEKAVDFLNKLAMRQRGRDIKLPGVSENDSAVAGRLRSKFRRKKRKKKKRR